MTVELNLPLSAVERNSGRRLYYVDQLEAHMDEDGKIGPNNVRDLIQMVRESEASIEEHARELVAKWMISHSYATGHGDTLNDLLTELVGQR